MDDQLPALIARYKADAESVYNTWFVDSPARLKAFRSILEFSELCEHCASVCKLGTDHRVMLKISRSAS